ncbi:MAG: hypothetical protein ABIH03_02350 [Pseudomonadota bacterium]
MSKKAKKPECPGPEPEVSPLAPRSNQKFQPVDLVILGKGASEQAGLMSSVATGCETWGVTTQRHPQLTMLFEMHRLTERHLAINPVQLLSEYPVVMQKKYAGIPRAVRYPIEAVSAYFGGCRYFNSTVAYMLAFAIFLERFKRIMLAGVDYDIRIRHEFMYERPNLEFWIGWAFAKGIDVVFPDQSTIMTTAPGVRGLMYAYDQTEILRLQAKAADAEPELPEVAT